MIWPILAALVAFVVFVEFVADVGGSGMTEHSPPFNTLRDATPTAIATPTPTPQAGG